MKITIKKLPEELVLRQRSQITSMAAIARQRMASIHDHKTDSIVIFFIRSFSFPLDGVFSLDDPMIAFSKGEFNINSITIWGQFGIKSFNWLQDPRIGLRQITEQFQFGLTCVVFFGILQKSIVPNQA